MSDEKKCTGPHCAGEGKAREPHSCPYQEEINEDHDFRCTCCELCTDECAMDI